MVSWSNVLSKVSETLVGAGGFDILQALRGIALWEGLSMLTALVW